MLVMSTDNRNRVQKGVSTGGQFAQESRTEDSNVALTRNDPTGLDWHVQNELQHRAQREASKALGRWQRSVDDPRDPHRNSKMFDEANYPDDLKQVIDEANNFKNLPLEDQARISGPELAHLLGPNQSYGSERVALGDDFEPDHRLLLLGLSAQRKMAESGIPGDITFVALDDNRAEFEVDDQGIKHRVLMQEGATILAMADDEDGDYEDWAWKSRARHESYSETQSADSLGKDYQWHHEAAIAQSVMAESPLRGTYESVGRLDHNERTVMLTDEGAEYTLHADGDWPRLTSSSGDAIHPAMVSGFMDHVAEENDMAGDKFYADLKRVFRETNRRIVR